MDKYCEAGQFLEASVILIKTRYSPYQLIAVEITSYEGMQKSLHKIRNYGALLSFMAFSLHEFDKTHPHIALYAWPTK